MATTTATRQAIFVLTWTALFFAPFHAYVVFGLASLSSVILHAGPLLIATLCARLLSLHWIIGATKTKQHQDNNGDDSHDDFLSMQLTAGRVMEE